MHRLFSLKPPQPYCLFSRIVRWHIILIFFVFVSELCLWDKAYDLAHIFRVVRLPLVMALGNKQTGSSEFTVIVINHQNERLMFFNWFTEGFVFCYLFYITLSLHVTSLRNRENLPISSFLLQWSIQIPLVARYKSLGF